MFSLKEKEVNTGRQRELDLVKGFLMIMIVFIHSFQTIAGAAAAESSVHKIMFALFMPTGACLYLFTMGFGSVFTRHSQPKDMVRNGIKLLIYQGISNLCYAAVMTVTLRTEVFRRCFNRYRFYPIPPYPQKLIGFRLNLFDFITVRLLYHDITIQVLET